MNKAIIKLSCTQVVDATSPSAFEKAIFKLSYDEYKMKQQAYNTDGSIRTFTALKAKDGRANSLHYKSGFAVAGLIDTLNKKISVLQDELPRIFDFDAYRFEVIESDTEDASLHKVAVHFISSDLLLLGVIGDQLLLSKTVPDITVTDETLDCFMIRIQPGISICSYRELNAPILETQLFD